MQGKQEQTSEEWSFQLCQFLSNKLRPSKTFATGVGWLTNVQAYTTNWELI